MALPHVGAVRRAGTLPPAWLVLAAAGSIGIVVYEAILPISWNSVVYNAFAPLGAVLIAAAVVRRRLRPALPHLLLAAGLLLMGLGDISWSLLEGAGLEPFPSFADGLYIAGPIAIAAGLWLRYGRARGLERSVVVETAIIVVGGGLLIWQLAIAPIVEGEIDDPLATAVAVGYPLLDLLLLGIVARLLLTPVHRDGAFRLAVAGCAAFLFADVLYSTQVLGDGYAGGIAEAGWLLGYTLFAASVVHPGAGRPLDLGSVDPVGSRPRLAALAVAAMLAPLLVIHVELTEQPGGVIPMAAGAVALSALVFARLAMALDHLRGSLLQRHRLQAALEHQANHDPLTGLANRALFTEQLRQTVAAGRPAAVLFIDLDDFKAVNDRFGHGEGDRLLVAIAGRLRGAVRPADLPARLGGDEFAVLLSEPATAVIATKVARRLLDAVREPAELAGQTIQPRASVGIARTDGVDAQAVMRNADVAMYLAKGQGKDRIELFDARLHAGSPAGDDARTAADAVLDGGAAGGGRSPVSAPFAVGAS